MSRFDPTVTRRQFLAATAAAVAGAIAPWPLRVLASATRASVREYELVAEANTTAALRGVGHPAVAVWAYNGAVPGPAIRVRQGERLRVAVTNRLAEETTVHWHGMRVPNAMDGVPHLTQQPIAPGARFVYEFDCPDAGTFWYHPHQRSFEQVGRGLYGPLIVEEREPIRVDRDLTWVLGDWRLTRAGAISDDFGDAHDIAHDGRVGNTVTINGVVPGALALRAGERIRLRLINAANARLFVLEFAGHHPRIIALDGQPVTPHAPAGGHVVLGPAMRVDIILDARGEPGSRHVVRDTAYKDLEYDLIELAYAKRPLRDAPLDTPLALPRNPLAEPDMARAQPHTIRFQGGMMGDLSGATLRGRPVNMMDMMHGHAWAVNGIVATGHVHDPILTLRRGRSYVLALHNDTQWHHPMHLHGHSFRVIRRNAKPTAHREWQDTVLMGPEEKVDIAFVADNPGDWMFHCHILEHQVGGMMATIRVA